MEVKLTFDQAKTIAIKYIARGAIIYEDFDKM